MAPEVHWIKQDRPAFGSEVTAYAIYERKAQYVNGANTKKYWKARVIEKRKGLYIGYRTLYDGVREWIGSEEGVWFIPDRHFEAALVVFSPRERPVYVPLSAMRCNDGGQAS